MFKPLNRQSLSEQVFAQLRDLIVAGDVTPGSALPSERVLAERLSVSRSAVREALKQLAEARLVSIQQGGATRVLDYRQTAGLNLLSSLLTTADGELNTKVVRSVMEMRSALAPDIARLAARRGGEATAASLFVVVAQMKDAQGDAGRLQELAVTFWDHLVDGSHNVAYRLVYNTLIESFRTYDGLLTVVLSDEHAQTPLYDRIAHAVRGGDSDEARQIATTLSRIGQRAIEQIMDALEAEGPEDP